MAGSRNYKLPCAIPIHYRKGWWFDTAITFFEFMFCTTNVCKCFQVLSIHPSTHRCLNVRNKCLKERKQQRSRSILAASPCYKVKMFHGFTRHILRGINFPCSFCLIIKLIINFIIACRIMLTGEMLVLWLLSKIRCFKKRTFQCCFTFLLHQELFTYLWICHYWSAIPTFSTPQYHSSHAKLLHTSSMQLIQQTMLWHRT